MDEKIKITDNHSDYPDDKCPNCGSKKISETTIGHKPTGTAYFCRDCEEQFFVEWKLYADEDRINVMEQIMDRHPSYGVEKGWSWYYGGMLDSGAWYVKKLLNTPIEELKSFLGKIIAAENTRPKVYSEQELDDMRTVVKIGDNVFMSKHSLDNYEKFCDKWDNKFLGIDEFTEQ